METLGRIVGLASDPVIADALHRVSHNGHIEHLTLSPADMKRHRLRTTTDRGTACAIALPRDASLSNGAVLLLAEDRAIVVRMSEQPVIRVRATDAGAALELGYLAGNMHWRVSFDGQDLVIAQEGDAEAYLARLASLIDAGRVERIDGDG